MTYYDAAMASVIVAGMVWGLFRGITWQVASLCSLILGYFGARTFSPQITSYFPGEPIVAHSLAMIALYAAISIGIFLIAWLVRATLKKLKFEAYDRHLGMLLGGVEGALLGLVVTLFVVSLAPKTREPIFSSPSGKAVGAIMSAVGPILPKEARKVLKPFWSDEADTEAEAIVADLEIPSLPPLHTVADRSSRLAPSKTNAANSDSESLSDLFEESKSRLKEAISDRADDQIRQTAETITNSIKEATGGKPSNGRTVERR